MQITGKTILITGGSSGLGLEFAHQLAARGNTVIVTGRDTAKLFTAVAHIRNVHRITADVSDPTQMASLAEQIKTKFPSLSILINNAGILRSTDFGSSPEIIDIEDQIAINLMGPIRLVSLLLPVLRQAPEAMIVNITSGLCYAPFPSAPIYSATKSAMHSYTQSLRMQLEHTNIRVVEILPPSVDTPMLQENMRQAMKGQKLASAQEVAKISITRLESGDREIRIGASNLLHWFSRLAPGMLARQISKSYHASR